MKNITKFILLNKFAHLGDINNIINNCIGKVVILTGDRSEMVDTAALLSKQLNVMFQKSELLDTPNIKNLDYPGFKLIKETETDTLIIIANSNFIGCLKVLLFQEVGITISSRYITNHLAGEVLLIDRTDKKSPIIKFI